jgi:hypothetical protein
VVDADKTVLLHFTPALPKEQTHFELFPPGQLQVVVIHFQYRGHIVDFSGVQHKTILLVVFFFRLLNIAPSLAQKYRISNHSTLCLSIEILAPLHSPDQLYLFSTIFYEEKHCPSQLLNLFAYFRADGPMCDNSQY